MFLRIVDFLASWVGPALVLFGIVAWFAAIIPHGIPGSIAPVLGGALFSGLSWFAAREEGAKTMKMVEAVSFVLAVVFVGYVVITLLVLA